MPYKRIKNKIYTKATGRWRLKQTCRSAASAKRALRLLRGLEKGTLTREDLRRYKRRKKRRRK